jgi:hypothetical protein
MFLDEIVPNPVFEIIEVGPSFIDRIREDLPCHVENSLIPCIVLICLLLFSCSCSTMTVSSQQSALHKLQATVRHHCVEI